MPLLIVLATDIIGFSALQRAEIAEIAADPPGTIYGPPVSVLFNEPKLLKYPRAG